MKKYINKLFERLGYVPKDKYNKYSGIIDAVFAIDAEIKLGVCEYQTFETEHNVFMTAYSSIVGKHRIIKVFPKGGTEDSADYARLCAEELCDMLNEKY